jgi:hypothetical protein
MNLYFLDLIKYSKSIRRETLKREEKEGSTFYLLPNHKQEGRKECIGLTLYIRNGKKLIRDCDAIGMVDFSSGFKVEAMGNILVKNDGTHSWVNFVFIQDGKEKRRYEVRKVSSFYLEPLIPRKKGRSTLLAYFARQP